MARWRLTAKHYLPIPGTEWEQKETDRDTGRTVRKVYTVPRYLDPDDPADWTDRSEAAIIVTNIEDSTEHRRDIYFLGEPTPDMEPLDDEARSISDSLQMKWNHPIESLPANGGMNEAEKAFMQTMMAAFTQQAGATQAVSAPGVDAEAFAKMQKQLEELAAANAALMAKLSEAPTEQAVIRRM